MTDRPQFSAPRSVQKVVPFLSGQTQSFSPGQIHRIKMHHEATLPRLASRMAVLARSDIQFELRNFEITDMVSCLVREEADPRIMLLFKADPLVGIGVFEVPRIFALALTDRMLGVRSSGGGDRDLREVELALLYQAIAAALEQYFGSWGPGIQARPIVVTHEVEAKFLPTTSGSARCFLIEFEASVGEVLETLRLVVPIDLLNPLVEQVLAVIPSADPQPKEAPVPRWNTAYEDVSVRVSALLPPLSVTPRQLLNLRVGDILPLAPDAIENVQIAIQGVPRFAGKLGSSNKKTAVEILRSLPKLQFVRS
jgi:flagellar motor switch protein FliM